MQSIEQFQHRKYLVAYVLNVLAAMSVRFRLDSGKIVKKSDHARAIRLEHRIHWSEVTLLL